MMRIETPRLIIRNWEERDRDLFHRINSDDRVMEFFPFRRTREEADAFMETIRAANEERGYGFAALELRETGECMGFAGLHSDSVAPARLPGAMEIGWRLAPEYWGKGYVTEAAEALLDFGFVTLDLDEIISFAVWDNDRSTSVMRRIGMAAEPESDFDHPRVPDTHPHLKRHAFYRITRDEWRMRKKAV
ncbi:GNAT family N-acetyltransferase [Aquamicrobium sp. LC103]|uniref:GNAT family N-acetyltransferase n=1 Tax=Aquamicrobium sp. LC103 TaxID=1120658 RepID=UPI00063E7D0E|nr:GNAT family N-acetyltransferase [Aquamicrobium sp. LC103]TKT80109.1 GNAT family N-acetyltransferase [Aquamicrobium sp. LC103]